MDDFKQTISKITKTITKTSSDVIKTTKLNISLSAEEEKLNKIYLDIGKKVHEIYSFGGSLGKFFDEQYAAIVKQEKIIDKIKSEINLKSGAKTCPNCGNAIALGSSFCSHCGNSTNPSTNTETTTQNVNTDEILPKKSETKKCPLCGCENEINTKFCLSCGRLL